MLLCLLPLAQLTLLSMAAEEPDYNRTLWNATYTDLLKRDLLATYDKFARPAQHTNSTRVYLDLVIRHVHLDDSKSVMTVNAWVKMEWKDEKLKWNASDYGGLDKLHLADHEIWEPDVVLYNSAIGNNIDHYGNTHCLVFSNGDVLWAPPSQFMVFCDMDLSLWPFDSHTCTLRLGSWTYSGEQIDLQIHENTVEPVNMESEEWNVVRFTKRRHSKTYPCCSEPYVDVTFNITAARRSPAYRAVVVTPALSIWLMTTSLFFLSPRGKERYFLSSLVALLVALFLIYFTIRLPITGPSTPFVIMFYGLHLMLVSMSIAAAVLFYNLRTSRCRIPWVLQNALQGTLGTILLLPKKRIKGNYEEETGSGGEELRDYEGGQDCQSLMRGQEENNWDLPSMALDRVALLIYWLLCSILLISVTC